MIFTRRTSAFSRGARPCSNSVERVYYDRVVFHQVTSIVVHYRGSTIGHIAGRQRHSQECTPGADPTRGTLAIGHTYSGVRPSAPQASSVTFGAKIPTGNPLIVCLVPLSHAPPRALQDSKLYDRFLDEKSESTFQRRSFLSEA